MCTGKKLFDNKSSLVEVDSIIMLTEARVKI